MLRYYSHSPSETLEWRTNVEMVKVNTASFVLRILAFSKPKHQVLPPLVEERLKGIKAWQSWVNALLAEPSVVGIWDEDLMIVRTKKKLLELSKK